MSDNIVYFTNPEDFNDKTSYLCKDAYQEATKFKKFFSENFLNYGLNSFSPTIAVFSNRKRFVGMVTCRPTDNKDDLYSAMAEMLFFPMSISSELFIVASDVNISSSSNGVEYKDALTLSFVTPDNCLLFTIPYTYDDSNVVTWHEDAAFINKIATGGPHNESPVGDLIELFFIFSHSSSTGPISHDEVLSYFDSNDFKYEILHPENMKDKYTVAIPFVSA